MFARLATYAVLFGVPTSRPVLVRALANPKPCNRPKAKATTQGGWMVKLVSPRQERTISGPRKRILRAIAAFRGGTGTFA